MIERRARRYFGTFYEAAGTARLADSRKAESLRPQTPDTRFNWVITSPPYYGMQTYLPDQWLRYWFVGGPDVVDYSSKDQISHANPKEFTDDLRQAWRNAASFCAQDAKMVIRFGGIASRSANPLDLIQLSLSGSGWRITAIRESGSAASGKRQADTFLRTKLKPVLEYDVWAKRE